MIAADTSSLRRFLEGKRGRDVDAVATGLSDRTLVVPPAVITELLSDPLSAPVLHEHLLKVTFLPVTEGFWQRAGLLRQAIRRQGFKAALADALIAQSCIDHDVPLITYDRNFRHFAKAGLKLL